MKLVLISDTHGYKPELPDGDILLHGGDLTSNGSVWECQKALDWLNAQPHKHIVVVAGNHDFAFEEAKSVTKTFDLGRIHYLEDSEITVEGLRIYGSPFTPLFMDWAFMVPRGEAIRKVWNDIPTGLDILITHGPPKGILDQGAPHFNSEHIGCEELAVAIERVKPRLHMFGHIHGSHGYTNFNGTEFFNCSMVSEAYRPIYSAWEVEFETNEQVAAPISAEVTKENI